MAGKRSPDAASGPGPSSRGSRGGEEAGKKILVSACLAGVPCRYDGGAKPCPAVLALLRDERALPLCPEEMGGLATPRDPSEIVGDRVLSRSGRDVTEAFRRGARACLEAAREHGCTEAVLKSLSPSCGSGLVYDGTFSGNLRPGDGVTARLLKENGIRVRTEEEI